MREARKEEGREGEEEREGGEEDLVRTSHEGQMVQGVLRVNASTQTYFIPRTPPPASAVRLPCPPRSVHPRHWATRVAGNEAS